MRNLLQSGGHYDTLQLGLTNGTTKKIAHADLGARLGGNWLPHFGQISSRSVNGDGETDECAVGATAHALGAEVDRVEVTIQNVDAAIGADVVSAARILAFAIAATGKFLFDLFDESIFEHRILFDGVVSATQASERTAKLTIISDRVAAGRILATKTLSPRNGWVSNDMSLPYPPSSGGGGSGGIEPPTECFTGETLIWTTAGDVPIRELVERFERGRLNFQVFCFDPATKRIHKTEVKQVFRHVVPCSRILQYRFEHGDLTVTPEHNVETVGGKCPAGKLTADVAVYAVDDRRKFLTPSFIERFNWSAEGGFVEVFNFEAAVWHTYFANRTAVYNRKDDPGLFV